MKNKGMIMMVLMGALLFSYGMMLWEILREIPQNITTSESFSYLMIILTVTVFIFLSLTGIQIIMARNILDNHAKIMKKLGIADDGKE